MKKLIFAITILTFVACKKEYTCQCTNPGGTKDVFTVKDSKSNAKSKCDKYYQDNFANVPLNETICNIK
ncbi:MAG: hypothetical protein ABI315_08580 [Bacteroidia bacterium]